MATKKLLARARVTADRAKAAEKAQAVSKLQEALQLSDPPSEYISAFLWIGLMVLALSTSFETTYNRSSQKFSSIGQQPAMLEHIELELGPAVRWQKENIIRKYGSITNCGGIILTE
ncbi:hypothetical protein B0H14DRAFT_2571314 [Mycena olivaceomarginata]|nr:hypothetical protein B0H14DRAFT_2571314 [Mycena olivaceomarginata]